MDGFSHVWANLNWSVLTDILLSILPALICLTIHELSHGLAAYRLGDNTAKQAGRLTLNPIRHIDPFGLLMMLVLKFGWAKPVPVDMRNFKHPKTGMAVTALAGPASNFILAAVILLFQVPIYRLAAKGESGFYIAQAIYTTAYLSLALGIFNLLPIPPLDGSKIAFSLLRDEQYYRLMRYERYGMIVLLVLVWSGVLGGPLRTVTTGLFGWLGQLTLTASQLFFA